MNDLTPAGPPSGFVRIISTDSGSIFADSALVAEGLSGNPVSIVPFRPNTSVQPWAYIGDSAPYPNVLVDSGMTLGFPCTGMIKVRSDGRSRKMGIAEPQQAPVVTFPGGGSGPSQIFYFYRYRAKETGARSNPSPVSFPGTNSQSSPSATEIAATGGVINPNISVNATQYEGNGAQIRTKGIPVGIITDPIIAVGFGPSLSVPANVTIDGVTADLNWLGQFAGTGILSRVSLYYLGNPIGNPKFPDVQNQSFAVDTFIGGSNDPWGASLTPAIVNDPSFGFGVTITTQSSGGSDRSFINFMKVIVSYSTQNADITPAPSPDPQVDAIDFFRQGGGLANPTYVGTGPNTATVFTDTLSDLAAANNPELEFFNYEPVPSIDLPRSGVINVDSSTQTLTYVSGDHFNTRWLPGTIIIIGPSTQIAYTAVRRPSSPTLWDFSNNDVNVPKIPGGTNLIWNIAEPDLAAQPVAYIFGVTDNVNYVFGVGDPNRPGTLYWCAGSNLDSWPDTNQMDVTDPGEPLVNGTMSGGLGVLFSIKRAWFIYPNFFNALATVTGTSGSTWTLQATSIDRGLFMPRCLAVTKSGKIYFRVDDGIHLSRGGAASISITDGDLYPLFPHESTGASGSIPQPITRNGVTIFPPDDSKPQKQRFSYQNGYMYYDHIGTDGAPHQWVFDERAEGWIWDQYAGSQPTVHAPNEGESQQGTLVGCSDGTVRLMLSNSGETIEGIVAGPAIGGLGWMSAYEATFEYACDSGATVSFTAADANNGSYAPQPIVLGSTGGEITKFTTKVTQNKWKLLQPKFDFTDPTLRVNLEGCVLSAKPWGDEGTFKPLPMFRPAGGRGPQE
ncbi:MAG TPA: hypothetical protein VN666_21910 [Nitrospira sp.]|nr:hypothetical protein [Nitrospira sp.]